MRGLFYLLFLAPLLNISANVGPQGFKSHLNRYFVETGSAHGNGIQRALDDGFEIIHSVEIMAACVVHCRNRFANIPNVTIWHKDSARQLSDVIDQIHEPITFWLDGHFDGEHPYGGKLSPIMEELEQIKRHPIKTHTILIDDLHCCETILFNYLTRQEIIDKVLEINPNYTISFDPGGDFGECPNNILVAKVTEQNKTGN